jgi:hypothetical protein
MYIKEHEKIKEKERVGGGEIKRIRKSVKKV